MRGRRITWEDLRESGIGRGGGAAMVDAEGTVATTEKRKRAKNWDTHEILLLVQAKKEEWERHEVSSKLETAAEKWARVVEFLQRKGIVDRDTDQCRGKWDNLLSDYKTIRDWRKNAGSRTYPSLTRDEKKLSKLPACFDTQVMDLLETFQGKKPTSCPPMLTMDSSDTRPPEPRDEDDLTDEARRERETRPSGRPKKKKKSPDMVSALHDMKESYVSSVVGMEKRRDKRHAKSLEFEKEKVGMEREDRRELIVVLGELAKAFDRIAEKM